LILDGLEVFQPYSSAELQGQLNDPAILGLLQTLAKDNAGLCLLTTRQALGEHLTRHQGVRNQSLGNLSTAAAIQLLQRANVKGKSEELERVVIEYHGHAYSLTLLASYLRQYAKGDIRRRDTLPALTDETRAEGWQAQQLFWAYADALEDSEDLGLLYLISVFDQAVERELILELIRALKQGGYQTALNKLKLIPLPEPQRWAACCRRLRQQGLLLGHSDQALDLHPLARDFFRREFAQRQGGIKKLIHLELYAYYKALPEKELPDTLEEMQPLFSAVAHGCAAGLHQQALLEVYWPRVRREGEAYIVKKLGAFSDDLATVAHFFTTPWHTPAAGLQEMWQAGMLNWAGFGLRALGRLREALEPMQASLDMIAKQEDWKSAAQAANNLSELQLTLGDVAQAVKSGARSSRYADQSEDWAERMCNHTTHADALYQAGDTAAALALFQEAEQILQEEQQECSCLPSLEGFRYCDLLLAQGSTAEVLERAEYSIEIAKQNKWLLDVALDQLTLGRAHLQGFLTPHPSPLPQGAREQDQQQAAYWLDQAVASLRAAGAQEFVVRGLLARAALHRHTRDFARARQDLQEVFDIADGSGMRLHLTDYHLEMARLLVAASGFDFAQPSNSGTTPCLSEVEGRCLSEVEGNRQSAQMHIAEAERLIKATGYHRRDKELAELQAQLSK